MRARSEDVRDVPTAQQQTFTKPTGISVTSVAQSAKRTKHTGDKNIPKKTKQKKTKTKLILVCGIYVHGAA